MNTYIANSLLGYFETLYDLNRSLIILCGVDVIDNAGQFEKYANDIILAAPRLIPYSFDKGAHVYRITDKDGLMEFASDIPFLKSDYETILEHHYDFLSRLIKIRNKFEHRMHGARLVSSGSSGSNVSFDLTYRIKDDATAAEQSITIYSSELVQLVKDLNCLYAKIQRIVEEFAYKRGEQNHLYYRRLVRYSFLNFNKIYDSNVLGVVGAALFPF